MYWVRHKDAAYDDGYRDWLLTVQYRDCPYFDKTSRLLWQQGWLDCDAGPVLGTDSDKWDNRHVQS